MMLMNRLLICLCILLMCGCSKVYECRTYSDSFCNLPIYDHSKGEWASETVNFKAVNVDEAEAVCVEDPDCFWEDNNCWNDSEPQYLPHLILMNDGNSSFSAHNFLPSNELPFLHSLGLMDADLDGDLDLLAIQEEDDDQFKLYLNNGVDDGAPEFELKFTLGSKNLACLSVMILDGKNVGYFFNTVTSLSNFF